jgi:hypothetical protein
MLLPNSLILAEIETVAVKVAINPRDAATANELQIDGLRAEGDRLKAWLPSISRLCANALVAINYFIQSAEKYRIANSI